jgi:hypothetical protein
MALGSRRFLPWHFDKFGALYRASKWRSSLAWARERASSQLCGDPLADAAFQILAMPPPMKSDRAVGLNSAILLVFVPYTRK